MTESRDHPDHKHSSDNRLMRALERRLGRGFKQFVFWRSMRRYLREVAEAREATDPQLLNELVRGWGNSWSAQHEFLEASLRETRATDGNILECGSGLSTVLIGAVAQARGLRVWSLEHEPKWADRVRQTLRKYRIHSVTVCMAPVRSYGDFDWYAQTSLQSLPGHRVPRAVDGMDWCRSCSTSCARIAPYCWTMARATRSGRLPLAGVGFSRPIPNSSVRRSLLSACGRGETATKP
jgi:hypothetical protein